MTVGLGKWRDSCPGLWIFVSACHKLAVVTAAGPLFARTMEQARKEEKIMFDRNRFVQDCRDALLESPGAVREVVAEAVSDSAGIMSELGEPEHAGITPIYRSDDLTILNFVWAPCMSLMPHNHQMFAVIGIYSGREDNIFWRRMETSIAAVGAKSLGVGEVAELGRDIIHSVLNPIGKMTCAIHVYGGDFFAPHEPRSAWDHETLIEQPWNVDAVKTLFREAETRFNCARQGR
jgi:predicted metal-dependent enzyme (double-stranded beta helix superfamily)